MGADGDLGAGEGRAQLVDQVVAGARGAVHLRGDRLGLLGDPVLVRPDLVPLDLQTRRVGAVEGHREDLAGVRPPALVAQALVLDRGRRDAVGRDDEAHDDVGGDPLRPAAAGHDLRRAAHGILHPPAAQPVPHQSHGRELNRSRRPFAIWSDVMDDLLPLINGYQVTQAIHVAVTLGVPDRLADGALTADDLAAATDAHAPSLYRLLRALAAVGILHEDAERRFALTALGEGLRSDAPD